MDLTKQVSKTKNKPRAMTKITEEEDEVEDLTSACSCFCCVLQAPDARLRRASLAAFFRDMPYHDGDGDGDGDGESCVMAVAAVWRAAMAAPDDSELPSLGALRCMSLLLARALADARWRRRGQNARIPYYAAHVIGSYTIRAPAHAELAVAAGAVRPLLALLGGAMTWVEQRAAARALGHLASYDATFPAVARHAAEAVPLAISAASACLDDVYRNFVALPAKKRPRYQRDLLTRGLGGSKDVEDRKAEEWASQLQCWSLYFLSCFASRDMSSHAMICQDPKFLQELCQMWGGLANSDSPAGVGLLRLLCRSAVGRAAIARCPGVLSGLCDLARSSDDWQYMALDCLLLLLDDRDTWHAVADAAAPCLVDLAELRRLGPRRRLGDAITRALLFDDHLHGPELGVEAQRAMTSLRELKTERKKREEAMSEEELLRRRVLAREKKREGNSKFWHGDVDMAMELYTEALELCPLSRRRDRLVLHSNRAQCWLARREPDAAVSDATRALALARAGRAHARSLWRRALAYDMKGMARESLLDCLAFAGAWFQRKPRRGRGAGAEAKLPHCVALMIGRQMSATSLFASVTPSGSKVGLGNCMQCNDGDDDGDSDDEGGDDGNRGVDFADKNGVKSCESGRGRLTVEEETAWRSLERRKKLIIR